MRGGTMLGLSMVVLVGATRPADAQAPRWTGGEAAIAELIERTQEANNAGDVAGWVSLFAEDFVYMAPGAPAVRTRQELTEVARAGFRHRAAIDIEPEEIEVFGPWAFARSHVTGRVELAGSGEVVSVDVKQIVIYRRDAGGEWRIARLISNSNAR